MKLVSGLDTSEFSSYPVFFDFDQDYSDGVNSENYKEMEEHEMGLVKPMMIREKDPYTGSEISRKDMKVRVKCCCCIP